ncbi:MAG: RadC family protein [Gammaproteobacteria bacterium]
MLAISQWPAGERPREKLIERGAQALSDAELLAVLLRTGISGRTAVDLARDLLTRFGGLRGLLEGERQALCSAPGMGAARFATLSACLEIGRRYLEQRMQRGCLLSSPADTRRFLDARLRAYPYEVFACLFLDNRHRVLGFEEMFRGTIDGANVYPREVVKRALALNAAALIAAHNHPSGVAEPSQADRALTRRLQDALGLVDVRLIDHIVIGDGELVSFAERGWL